LSKVGTCQEAYFLFFLEELLERVSGKSSTLRMLNISGNSLHQVRGELLADALRWEYNLIGTGTGLYTVTV
jgi:hypothetical protein